MKKKRKDIFLQKPLYCYYLLAFQLHLGTKKVDLEFIAYALQANGKSTTALEKCLQAQSRG